MHRYGDLEATEDLIAVGHDVNAIDGEKRTPLHYAVAYRCGGMHWRGALLPGALLPWQQGQAAIW